MIFGRAQKISQPRAPKEDKCRIKVKKNTDGSYTKEISGNCSREVLEALANEKGTQVSSSEEF